MGVLKSLSENYIRETVSHLSQNFLWINRLFVNLVNKNESTFLTINCHGINPNGLGRFRTEAENGEKRTCYFNISKIDNFFNTFLSKEIKDSGLKETNIHY